MGTDALDTHIIQVASVSSRDDTDDSQASLELGAAFGQCPQEWLLIEDADERFAAFSALPQKAKDTLVTYCVAQSLRIGVRGSGSLIERLDVTFADYWRPGKDNYFGRLNKAQLLEQWGAVRGQGWVDAHCEAKKAAVVESLEEYFKETPASADDPRVTWLPPEF